MSKSRSLVWLPNAITIARIIAAPVVTGLMLTPLFSASDSLGTVALFGAFILFTLSAATDWLDGWLARKLNVASALGAKLDLWADKILVFCFLIGIVWYDPRLTVIGLISLTARDLYVMRLRAEHPNIALSATSLAKYKTALAMFAMALLLLGVAIGNYNALMIGKAIFLLSCALSLLTGWQYVRAVRKAQT